MQAAAIALWAAFAKRGIGSTILGAVGLGLGISIMHYSGMRATQFLPIDSVADLASPLASGFQLAIAVTAVIYCVWALALIVFTLLEFQHASPS
jgi:NO-binding membrane sensor protein with MHYT domain